MDMHRNCLNSQQFRMVKRSYQGEIVVILLSDEDISRGPNLENSFSDQSISVEDKKVIPAMDDDGVRLQQRLAPCCSLADEVNCDLNVSMSIYSGVGLQALYNNMDEPKMEMTWLGKQRGLRWQPMDCPPSPSWIES